MQNPSPEIVNVGACLRPTDFAVTFQYPNALRAEIQDLLANGSHVALAGFAGQDGEHGHKDGE